jgi:sigma-B regulation protein RsbU (phosphoserine phosphatase)
MQLILGVCGLVLLTGGVILWLANRSARASTNVLVDRLFREVSNRAATHTRGYVMRAAPVVESLAQLADKGLSVDDSDRLAPQLLAVLKANPGLSWVSYGDENGTFTGAYRTNEGGLRINQSRIVAGKTQLVEHDLMPDGSLKVFRKEPDSGYDPRVRPFYIKAKKERRVVWLPPYVFYYRGVPGITCAAPVQDSAGKLRGVLTVDFDLNALSDFVSQLSVSEHSRVFLFTADEVLLAHPDHRIAADSASRGEGELPKLNDVANPLVVEYRSNLQPQVLQATDGQDFHFFEFRHEKADYLGSATTFQVGDDLVWVVGVVAPKADFVGDVWRTQAVALTVAGGAVLAAVLVAFALASSVSRPVSSLIGFMQRVGRGDLEARAELGGHGEFRQLSEALNRMIADLRDRLRLRHSLNVAMEVQQRLLPSRPPKVAGLDVAGHSTYCDETGGDYYDFLIVEESGPGTLLIALGDVMGHGVAAALVMAGARAVLRDRAGSSGGLADLIGHLNRLLAADLEGTRFMTMHLSEVNPKMGTIRWVSAGHDPAILFDPATGEFQELEGADLPLGVMEDTVYEEHSFSPIKPGQIITVGTDGVWEMPNTAGEQFGKQRLRDAIKCAAGGTANDIAKTIVGRLTEFRGDCRPVDDVTFVIIKVMAAEERS